VGGFVEMKSEPHYSGEPAMSTTVFASKLVRFSTAILAFIIFLALDLNTVAQPLVPDHYLHILMVIDTDSTVGKSTKADRENIKASILKPIRDLGRHGYLGKVEILEGKEVNKDRILRYFRSLPRWSKFDDRGRRLGGWDTGDTILFYYSGHGGTKGDGQHVLTMTYDNVPRKVVEEEIKRLRPRLSLILTDCCASFASETTYGKKYGGVTAADLRAMRKLFLRGRGIVNINSSEKGKSSYGFDPPVGGLFTNALFTELQEAKEDITWKRLIDKVDDMTPKICKDPKLQQKVWRMSIEVNYKDGG
jgi:hypothetical protein